MQPEDENNGGGEEKKKKMESIEAAKWLFG